MGIFSHIRAKEGELIITKSKKKEEETLGRCERCGKDLTKIDPFARDANGQYYCIVCSDICLAEWKEQGKYIDELRHKIEVQIGVNCELADENKKLRERIAELEATDGTQG